MNESLLQFGLTAFIMLIVVINPLAVAPVFIAVTNGMDLIERRSVLNRAVVASFGVALFFLIVGRLFLSFMGVTVHAFAISGGILLFTLAFPMLVGQRSVLRATDRVEPRVTQEDVAIFPLTIPQLAGPGTIATILVLATQAEGDWSRLGILIGILIGIYLMAWPTLYAADRIVARLGESKMHVITRMLGLVLAALAVQYVLNGIAGFYSSLVAP
ncbi:MAG TPA: MarC family protein [Anaerolineae bacterium]|nr:MarC family protein [Anaerolineae bacterium]HMR68056.1 MarC family protein [Anaerolineae bacterium]